MSVIHISILGVSLSILLALSMPSRAENMPPERLLGKDLTTYQPSYEEQEPEQGQVQPHLGDLTLLQAQSMALQHNAGLAAQAWELEGASGEYEQAGLLPNPDLSIEVENFAGEDDLDGFDGAETTVAISQLIELGGKRSKRQKSADLHKKTASWDYEAKRLDTLTDVTKAYIEVVAAQSRLKQAKVLAELAGAVHQVATERVEAGKVAPVEQTRSAVVLASARLTVKNAKRELDSRKLALSSFWGNKQPMFSKATDNLDTAPVLPALEKIQPLVEQNPDIARWGAELDRSRSELALAESTAIPDLTLSLGWRNFQEDNSNALVAGVEFPLPIFDRNQGGRKAAVSAVNTNRFRREEALRQVQASLAASYQELASAHTELTVLSRELLPGAQSAFEVASLGYREGKFGFLDVLDAQRTLFEVRGQFVSALVSYHLAQADIERLIARPLDTLSSNSNDPQEVQQ